MAKALGLIGNFKGKLGNTVGYSLKDSNNKQTQGVRVYQPVVRNPKTYAQSLQRAKLAPINATYRALKMVIDRGQEGVAYGNKSRLAWLSAALIGFEKAYFVKGDIIDLPALVTLTKGSLPMAFSVTNGWDAIDIAFPESVSAAPTNLGELTDALIATDKGLQDGDQVTFVVVKNPSKTLQTSVFSFVLESGSTAAIPSFLHVTAGRCAFVPTGSNIVAGTCIISREGNNGQHLRSTSPLFSNDAATASYSGSATAEEAAKSYMSQGVNTDWAEESLM